MNTASPGARHSTSEPRSTDPSDAGVPVLDRKRERSAQRRQVELEAVRHLPAEDEHLAAVADRRGDRLDAHVGRADLWQRLGAHLHAARGGEPDASGRSAARTAQEMPHAVGLGAQVVPVDRVRRHGQRHALDDVDAVALQRRALERVVGEQSHLAHPERPRISAAAAYSRRSTGNPSARLASTVSRPCPAAHTRGSCWPDRSRDPLGASTAARRTARWRSSASAADNCWPQSHRIEPSTSPVRHSECIRTRGMTSAWSGPRISANLRRVCHRLRKRRPRTRRIGSVTPPVQASSRDRRVGHQYSRPRRQ